MQFYILSQDKDTLVPLNNPIMCVEQELLYSKSDGRFVSLGVYETHWRVQEILNEIRCYLDTISLKNASGYSTYIMPKE